MRRISQRISASLRSHPYRNIFAALLLFLALDATDFAEPTQSIFSDLCLAFVLVSALVETVRSRRHAVVAAILGLPAVLGRILGAVLPPHPMGRNAILVLSILFMGFLIWHLLSDLLKGSRATDERVFGALSAYLFIGILFALLYTHMYHQNPGAFSIPDTSDAVPGASEGIMLTTFMYFSFVTLTTLGFGEIVPLTDHTRTLVYVEALIGQLFLAVMVAGLVGASVSEAASRKFRAANTNDGGQNGEEES